MIMSPFSLSVVVPVAVSVALSSPASADVVSRDWLAWQAAAGNQPIKNMLLYDLLPATYSPGDVIAGDAFRQQWCVTFTSTSPFVCSPPVPWNMLNVQIPGTSASVTWDAPISSVYYGAFGQGYIRLWHDDVLVYNHWWSVSEAGFISTESFNRMEFLTQSGQTLRIGIVAWVVPAPGAAAWLVCGLATGSRRRRRSS